MLSLLLIHGRFDPGKQMEDWGFAGPTLTGIVALHVTYMATLVLYFTDHHAAQRAHALTGWPHWDDTALELMFHDDLLMVRPISLDRPAAYYGDWELQGSSHPT